MLYCCLARLNSCLDELRNILGESTPEHIMVDMVVKNNFNYEKALSAILAIQGEKLINNAGQLRVGYPSSCLAHIT